MSISLYSIYAKSCTDLAFSLIIKSEATAMAMNEYDKMINNHLTYQVGEPSFFDETDKRTWRYYMHMAGMYHRLDRFDWVNPETNKIERIHYIKVYSIDTYEYIDFTKENLKLHRATWREYQKGSTYYQNLVDKYPKHRLLIDGILNPIDIDKAINARDNEILYYDKRHIEENEYTLIDDIQFYIDKFYSRWDNQDYALIDDLYIPAKIAILYIYLPYVIMDIRYRHSRSIEAHTFHVWNYLGSHQWLDEFKYHLNLYQRMWFYRNIRWSEVNAGKLDTFYKHIDVVMTNRSLPIAEFETTMITEKMKENEEVVYPDTLFKRLPLNMHDHLTKADTWRDIPTMVDAELNEARDNSILNNLRIDKQVAEERLTRTPDRVLPTKVLESNVYDTSKRAAIKKMDVELNHWIYMTMKGMYKARISVVNPVTTEFMNMTQKEAVIMFVYALMKSHGLNPSLIPTITVSNVLKLTKPNFNNVRKLMDDRWTSYTYAYAADHYVFEPPLIISTEAFSEFIDEVYSLKNIHRNLYSFSQDYREHIQIKTMVNQYYETVVCRLTEKPMRFKDYFKYRGWELEDSQEDIKEGIRNWTIDHYTQLANDITKVALGNDLLKRHSIKEIQGMMLRLLKKLSSYSVQFLRKINEDEVTVFDWPYLRYHKRGHVHDDYRYLNLTQLDFFNAINQLYHKYPGSLLGKYIHAYNGYIETYAENNLNLILDIKDKGETVMHHKFRMPTTTFRYHSSEEIIPTPIQSFINPWDMDKFRIHKTTEDRSLVKVDEDDGTLVVRGVVYVKNDYTGDK